MKIALAGTGRMGAAVARIAEARGHVVAALYDAAHPPAADAPPDADVVIDFTLPDVIIRHIDVYLDWGIPAVVGTTGWYGELDGVEARVEAAGGALLYAPNFSLGVAVLQHALRAVVPLLDALPDFDPYLHEVHHTGKADSPSGTAHALAETLVAGLDRKERVEAETQHGRIDPAALHVSSTRAGRVFGTHEVGFDGPYELLTFRHEAKGRDGFAFGAVRAAEWLPGRSGLYTLDDALADWMG